MPQWYNDIPEDKKLHLFGCMALVMILDIFYKILISYGITIVVGAGKEILWDKLLGYGTASRLDMKYSLAGATIGLILSTILQSIIAYALM